MRTTLFKTRAFLISAYILLAMPLSGGADVKVYFSGTLVDDACTVEVGSEGDNQVVDLKSIITKYLYINKSSYPEKFSIHLKECDTSISEKATLTFLGTEDGEQPGLLKMEGTTMPISGVAIKIEEDDGTLLPVNTASRKQKILDGQTVFSYQVSVQASDEAIAKKSVTTGEFSSTVTFRIDYL